LEVNLNPKGKYAILLLSSILVTYAIVGGKLLHQVSAQDGMYRQLSLFNEVLHKVQDDYVDAPSTPNAITGAIRGLIETVDPEGGYLSAKDVAFYKSFDPLKTPGIGVILGRTRLGYPVILSVLPDGPGQKAGLMAGDMIEAIDGLPTREMNLVQVDGFLANPPDKPATLTVIRRNTAKPESVMITRGIVNAPPVNGKMLENNIAYVHVPILTQGKAAEARKDIDNLLKSGATSIILDLRASAGGDEAEGIALANLFLDSGTIGYAQGQKSEKRTLTVDPQAALTKAPLAVLVNEWTSGPAELIAGAIRDSKRGQVVGKTTFGNGSVQKLIPMDDGSALLIAVARYYTPSGKVIEETGIDPQVAVEAQEEEKLNLSSDQEIEIPVAPKKNTPASDEDRQLKKAIEILKDPQAARKPA
jgi:carboxyl-terminal processing protease